MPANMICMGFKGSCRRRFNRSISLRTSVARLYPVKRRQKPMVSTSGSNRPPIASTWEGSTWSSAQRVRALFCIRLMSLFFSHLCTPQISSSGMSSMRFQKSGSSCRVNQSCPRCFENSMLILWPTQVGKWTPFVIWLIGTLSSLTSGHNKCHMRRQTPPCSRLTPLHCPDIRMPSTVMLKLPFVSSRPNLMKASLSKPSDGQ